MISSQLKLRGRGTFVLHCFNIVSHILFSVHKLQLTDLHFPLINSAIRPLWAGRTCWVISDILVSITCFNACNCKVKKPFGEIYVVMFLKPRFLETFQLCKRYLLNRNTPKFLQSVRTNSFLLKFSLFLQSSSKTGSIHAGSFVERAHASAMFRTPRGPKSLNG